MKKTSLLLVLVVLLLASCQEKEHWAERYNVKWDSPSDGSRNSMPLGGHDIGCNVWVEDGDLFLYIQKSGSFSEIGELLKLGRLRIQLTPNPFKNIKNFSQELVLKDGNINIRSVSGVDVQIKLWVDIFTESVHIDVNSATPISYKATYENWRTEDRNMPNTPDYRTSMRNSPRFGSYHFVSYPGAVIKKKDEIRFDKERVLFYHRNEEHTPAPEFEIKQQGMEKYKDIITNANSFRTFGGLLMGNNAIPDGTTEGTYYKTNFKGWSIKSKEPDYKHHITVATYIKQEKDITDWKKSLDSIASLALKNNGQLERNVEWWKEFWDKSHIVIEPDDKNEKDSLWQVGRNYNLFRYQLGFNHYGKFPTKFNGGLLVFDSYLGFDPDYRKWGGDHHTAQNQRLVYWPMLKTGDFEAMLPQFELYMMGMPGAQARVKENFGHKGVMFCENTDPAGMNIPVSWGWNDPGSKFNRPAEVPFCDPKVQEYKGDRAFVEKGMMTGIAIAYYATVQVEFAYMMLEYYRYSGESIERYLPFIKNACIFYDEHYRLRHKRLTGKELDGRGKLRLFPAQACEAYIPATNPTDLIAGLKTVLTELLKYSDKFLTEEEVNYYKAFLKSVPDLPWKEVAGGKIMEPAEVFIPAVRNENPRMYPLFPYKMYSVLDKEIEYFKTTWELDTTTHRDKHLSWDQKGIFFAHMGLVDECVAYQKKKLGDSGLRFPTFWGPGFDWFPDHNWGGTGMIGLQDMLMQTPGDKIILLPCWPLDKDVSFKLHAPKQTVVEVEYKNGEIQKLDVTPKERREDVVFWNKKINNEL